MRILHVITSLRTGGAEKLLVEMLPRLKKIGHEVELLLFDGTVTPFYNELKDKGIDITYLSISGNVYNPINIFKLRKNLQGYDIIHTHNTACQYYVAIALGFKHKCKLITTEHSTHNRRRNLFGFKFIDKWIYRHYDHIIAISKKAEENLRLHIGNSFPICTINNGIDISKYSSEILLPDNKKDIIITMVAGFRPEKDHETLIKAITLLPPNYKLWLVGDGERRKSIEQTIVELDLGNRVTLWGNRNDVPELLSKSHIVVLSSHWEGLSLSSIEGMASGRPFICSDVDGLREIVANVGILVPPQDHITLANEIIKLCTNVQYYLDVANQCSCVAKNYGIERMLQNYINVIYRK